jgi:hypothetical protein
MPFDFRTRANQLAEQKERQQHQDIQKRDRNNEIAREIVQGLLSAYAGRLGTQFASVQSNVATIRKHGDALTVTVLGENEFRVKEESGFGDPQLDDNLQKDQLDRNGMMDTIIKWLDGA